MQFQVQEREKRGCLDSWMGLHSEKWLRKFYLYCNTNPRIDIECRRCSLEPCSVTELFTRCDRQNCRRHLFCGVVEFYRKRSFLEKLGESLNLKSNLGKLKNFPSQWGCTCTSGVTCLFRSRGPVK